jgi:hypothetical protein
MDACTAASLCSLLTNCHQIHGSISHPDHPRRPFLLLATTKLSQLVSPFRIDIDKGDHFKSILDDEPSRALPAHQDLTVPMGAAKMNMMRVRVKAIEF